MILRDEGVFYSNLEFNVKLSLTRYCEISCDLSALRVRVGDDAQLQPHQSLSDNVTQVS